MSEDLRQQIHTRLSQKETDELLEIWHTHDRDEWSEMAFDAIREILQERDVELPPEAEPVHKAHESEGVTPLRPRTVLYAVYLALAGFAVQAVQITISLVTRQLGAMAEPRFSFFLALLFAGILGFLVFEAWLIYGTWLGRNRRRILYIVWIVLSTVFMLANGGWAQGLAVQPVRTAVGILANGIELVAVVLLLLPISNAWFREMRQAKPSDEQTTQRKKRSPQRRRQPTWPSELSPDRWVRRYSFGTLAISFALSLLASWLVYNLVLWLQEPDYAFYLIPNVMYVVFCLPVQAVALLLGAVIGARSARIPEARWRQATYGVWIVGLISILSAIFGAGILPKSGV